MASASGQRTALRFAPEIEYGVPSTAYSVLRFTDTSLNLAKETYQSNEVRDDRQTADLRHGMRSVGGDFSFELSRGTFDVLLAAALSGTWRAVTTGAASLEAEADAFVRDSGNFLEDGFLPGDMVVASGFAEAGNNGRAKVVAVSALRLEVDRALTVDAAAAGRTVALVGQRLANGTELVSFGLERAFTDISQFMLYRGCAVDSLSLSVTPGEIVTCSMSFLGKDMVQATATHAVTLTPAGTGSPFDAFTGALYEGGQRVANVTAVELEIANGRSVQGVVGHKSPQEVHEGAFVVTGSISAYFKDAVLLNRFINEEESSLELLLEDVNGTDFHRIYLPRIKYTGGDVDNPNSGPVTVSMPFTALLDATSGATILYQRSNP
ncbi:phage tail tube protein [Myxococcus sp. MxC21-1]|uniref:phage tail tube protein n=1 Tax=Myxococcus sp. MxC21-1 TaxID=3041439 RepID=UPI00293180B8|nr:phage tail tube protein [Myxococcus sp. MxC21-1]WNZ59905.1 phage tail tube protein [Myxococcus sp. MxC21-1]